MKKVFMLFLVGFFLLGSIGVAKADPIDKLGRGVVNVLTCWLEIPVTVFEDSVDINPLFGGTFGIVHGCGRTLYRAGAGIVDIVLFPFPPFDDHIIPEFVF